jgi:hypothetical protein
VSAFQILGDHFPHVMPSLRHNRTVCLGGCLSH